MTGSLLHFATYFDRHYLTRGLALYQSLVTHSPPFVLWVLCLDDETFTTLVRLQLTSVSLIRLDELERADPVLLAVKPSRKPIEYYWTCGPAFLRHLFAMNSEIDLLTYLDADVCLFSDPAPLFSELGHRSILIIEHRHNATAPGGARRFGKYNVGLLMFRRDANALACLETWREQCLDWCFWRKEEGRFGDQLYLDEWPTRYEDVVILDHKGAGVAPWNLGNYRFAFDNRSIVVVDVPLVMFHFSMVRRVTSWFYDTGVWRWNPSLDPVIRRHVYLPYVHQLRAGSALVESVGGVRPRTDNVLRKEPLPLLLYWTLWRRTYVALLPTVSSWGSGLTSAHMSLTRPG